MSSEDSGRAVLFSSSITALPYTRGMSESDICEFFTISFLAALLCALLSSSAGFSSEMRTSASASSEYAEAVSFIDADFFIICGRTFTPTSVTIAKQAARLPYLTRSLFALLCFVLFLVESAAFSTFPSFSARICAMTEFFMLVCGVGYAARRRDEYFFISSSENTAPFSSSLYLKSSLISDHAPLR